CGFSGFVESPHCEIAFPKAVSGVVSSFSAALFFHVVSLSSRFETTPDLCASKHMVFIVCKA
ncbi:hypothetical protein, partial [Vibrio parahaemolyticus]|uniref:hypothetical protein n=1 Tax=Vibrio parahaemolyticus TaxID=670 RepID=UPI001E5AD09C